jgi:hypothetical protein
VGGERDPCRYSNWAPDARRGSGVKLKE